MGGTDVLSRPAVAEPRDPGRTSWWQRSWPLLWGAALGVALFVLAPDIL